MSLTSGQTLGLRNILTLKDLPMAEGKVVFLRLDLNVPMNDKKQITDETRILASLPTLKTVIGTGAKVIVASHLGRPKSVEDKKFSLEPVAQKLTEHLGVEVLLFDEPQSRGVKGLLVGLKKNQIILLENIRFAKGETEDSDELAQAFASYSDIYVNDAFGASHRAHASIHALPKLMKFKGIGHLIEKEVTLLDQLLDNPKKPYVAILGGAKVSDKIAVIEKLIDLVDVFLIGGAMAYTFLKAQGHPVGRSLVEENQLRFAREMIERIKARNKSILLPVDHVVSTSLTDTQSARTTSGVGMKENELGVDIGPKTLIQYEIAVQEAGTIFWNGPMGIFETKEFSRGTFGLAKAIAGAKNAMKVVGGGDSASAAEASGYASQMTHISTGGGASLEYLQGDKLPGLEVLRTKKIVEVPM
jgi:phosphoglycerate kinase